MLDARLNDLNQVETIEKRTQRESLGRRENQTRGNTNIMYSCMLSLDSFQRPVEALGRFQDTD